VGFDGGKLRRLMVTNIQPVQIAGKDLKRRHHRELLAAYEEGDRAQVERLMTEHIHHAGTLIGEKEFPVDAGVLLQGGG
jgi:DNA-binding GntR family transcriptional regulator